MEEPLAPRSPDPLLQAFDVAAALASREREWTERQRTQLLAFVEVMDAFDRLEQAGAGAPPPADAWKRSCCLVGVQLQKALAAAGVLRIPCLGQRVIPEQHVVVGTTSAGTAEDGVIVGEVLAGYRWQGAILRQPHVLVARTAPSENS